MAKFGKVALASFKVFRKEIKENIGDFLDGLGVSVECEEGDLAAELEQKREEVKAKIDRYFDGLKREINDESCHSEAHTASPDNKILQEMSLTMKELRHQLDSLRADMNELKNKSH